MARLEIPSIVVHNGSTSPPSSPPTHHVGPNGEGLTDNEGAAGISEESAGQSPLSPQSPDPSAVHRGATTSPSNDQQQPCVPPGPGPGGGSPGCTPGGVASDAPVVYSPGHSPSRSRSLDLQAHHLDTDLANPSPALARNRVNKQKQLQRSHAMREDASPPPDLPPQPPPPPTHHGGNSLTVSPTVGVQGGPPTGPCPPGGRRRLRHQGSSQSSLQGSFDGSSPCLSRESSMEYTDSSGVDLLQFIIQTLHKNQKDRAMLLKIERELINLVRDSKRTHHKFQQMSSYHRMLVHRCAAYFGLEHNVDQAGTAVIVNKTRNTRLPETRFREHFCEDMVPPDELPKRSILRREFASFEDTLGFKSPERGHLSDPRRSKSFEERQEEYHRAKKRIFSQESFSSMEGGGDQQPQHRCSDRCRGGGASNCHEDFRWHDRRAHCWHYPDTPPRAKHYYDSHRLRPGRLPKVESFESAGARALRPAVFKSHSFGGYSGGVTVLSRGDSVAMSERLTKQDSTSSRMSEQSSSSGYKTQRQDTSSTNVSNTLSTTPSPVTSHHHPNLPPGAGGGGWSSSDPGEAVMWAVTDMDAVPAGAMLINPQSGQPYLNQDGSVYRYDPNNPPHLLPPPPPPPGTAASSHHHHHHLPPIHHQAPHHSTHHHHQHHGHHQQPPPLHHHHHTHCPHEGLPECEGPQHSSMYPLTPSPPRECGSTSPQPPGPGPPSNTGHQPGSCDDNKCTTNEDETSSSSPTTIVLHTTTSASCQGDDQVTTASTSNAGNSNAGVTSYNSSSNSSTSAGSPTTPRNTVVLTAYNRGGGQAGAGPAAAGGYTAAQYYGSMPETGVNRACSVDSGLSEVTGQLRSLNLTSSAMDPHTDVQHPQQQQHTAPAYMIPRHFPQAVYYVPSGSAPAAGHVKYVYPQHYSAPHPHQTASAVGVVGGGAANPMAVAHGMDMASLTPGGAYLPGGYTMMSYSGVMAGGHAARSGPQEAGGTTYYCPAAQAHHAQPGVPPPPPPPPPPPAVSSTVPSVAPPVAPPTIHQYPMTPPTSTAGAYQPLVGSIGYYGAGLYPGAAAAHNAPAAAAVAAAGAVYAANTVTAGSSVHGTAPHYHRAATPPHTTQTQVISVNPLCRQPAYRWGF